MTYNAAKTTFITGARINKVINENSEIWIKKTLIAFVLFTLTNVICFFFTLHSPVSPAPSFSISFFSPLFFTHPPTSLSLSPSVCVFHFIFLPPSPLLVSFRFSLSFISGYIPSLRVKVDLPSYIPSPLYTRALFYPPGKWKPVAPNDVALLYFWKEAIRLIWWCLGKCRRSCK